jgi:peptide/nickel transport system substrate-binding protein
MELYDAWRYATTSVEREAIWKEILRINAEQVWTIGLVAGVPQPIVASAKLMNIPAEAVYNWEPGAQFGIYQPASFWLAE